MRPESCCHSTVSAYNEAVKLLKVNIGVDEVILEVILNDLARDRHPSTSGHIRRNSGRRRMIQDLLLYEYCMRTEVVHEFLMILL